MGTVQKVLLYGGTFDPPHNGHMNNLRAALELVRPDKAIVMPAGIPPHKKASTTPGKVRLAMCQCFTALSPAVEVSDWEIAQGGRSYTVHTLEMLRDAYPGVELYLCVGSDMLLTFTQWYRWQDMLAMAALVVESREAGDEPALQAGRCRPDRPGRQGAVCQGRGLPLCLQRHPQRQDPAGTMAGGFAAGNIVRGAGKPFIQRRKRGLIP